MIQVFSKKWFVLHQKKLLWFANTWFGRYVLRIHGKRSSVGKNRIARIDPNAITWAVKKGKKKWILQTEFRTHDKFAKRLYYAFLPIWWLFHGWDWLTFKKPVWSLGFDTLTQYPRTIGTNEPCDGLLKGEHANSTLADLIASAGTSTYSTTTGVALVASATENLYSSLYRAEFCFDTSSLTSGADISAVVLSLYGYSKANGLGDIGVSITASTPAATSSLANSDFEAVGDVAFSTKVYADLNTSGYTDWTLDSNGIANISKTGISCYGEKSTWDLAGSGPTWANSKNSLYYSRSASTAGTTSDPKLVVTYTVSGGAGAMLLLGAG